MCGRFSQFSSPEIYANLFGINPEVSLPVGHKVTARYNVTPGSEILACRRSTDGQNELVALHWGLIPSWSKGLDKRYSMINARAETVASKPAYRVPFRRHRCLIPVDGFYEWHSENGKQPYYIRQVKKTPLALAGLWDHWDDGEGDKIESCSIIVCEASRFMQPIHERMPVILEPAEFENWLSSNDTDQLQRLLLPYAGDDLEMYPVSLAVNNPRNENAALIRHL